MICGLIDDGLSFQVEPSAEDSLYDQVVSRGCRAETHSEVNLPLWRNVQVCRRENLLLLHLLLLLLLLGIPAL